MIFAMAPDTELNERSFTDVAGVHALTGVCEEHGL